MLLKFSKANAKIKALSEVPSIAKFLTKRKKVYSLDLLSGWSCPFAVDCLSKVKIIDGKRKIFDGKNTKFRCFSASQEVLFPKLYALRKHNFDLLKECSFMDMVNLIEDSLPKNIGVCRIHVGGDFFCKDYFDAWLSVSLSNPEILFYAYTKSLPYWVDSRILVPDNFVLTASRGGRRDDMIFDNTLREAVVAFDEITAWNAGLDIDHDDSHAADPSKVGESFALLLHGTQPKGTEAAKALSALKGKGSYSKRGAK